MGARSYLILFVFLFSEIVHADVMNLNEFMPTRIEDATPTDPNKFEVQLSSKFEKMRESEDETTFRTNFRYGLNQKLQLEGMTNIHSGGEERNSGDFQLGGQYLINTTEKYVPEVAVSPNFIFPTGKHSQGIDSHLRFNITSTLLGSSNTPMTQIHINIDWGVNQKPDPMERADRYFYAFGVSHRFSDSGSIIFDIYREEETEKDEISDMFEIGMEYDIGSSYYIGLGSGAGIGNNSSIWHAIVSLEKQI